MCYIITSNIEEMVDDLWRLHHLFEKKTDKYLEGVKCSMNYQCHVFFQRTKLNQKQFEKITCNLFGTEMAILGVLIAESSPK